MPAGLKLPAGYRPPSSCLRRPSRLAAGAHLAFTVEELSQAGVSNSRNYPERFHVCRALAPALPCSGQGSAINFLGQFLARAAELPVGRCLGASTCLAF